MKSRLNSFAAVTVASACALFACACSDSPTQDQTQTEISSDSGITPPESSGDHLDPNDPVPESSAAADVPPAPQMTGMAIDDFEDGDLESQVGGAWYVYDDNSNGGASTIEGKVSDVGYGGSTHSYYAEFTLDKGEYVYDPYVAIALGVNESLDFSNLGGISYCYKGPAHTVRVETSDITDYNVHGLKMKVAREWSCVVVKFRDISQEDWGEKVDFNKLNINQISFQFKGGAKVKNDSFYVDNVMFVDEASLPADVADLLPHSAEIPVVTIGDVEVKTALQEKAMKYLDKGVNFTNWLEEAAGKFNGKFKFGEDDVKKLAENGFKSIRLPIDLDLYVTNRKAFLAGEETELKMDTDTLFMVLDAFDKWTKENGMSFVIDYHEYDNSYNATSAKDSVYRSMMAGVWKVVAEHFAASEREDIFFELLNEPDMTSGKVDTATWTIAAQGMIDAIRSVDKTHSIIFGDVQWYSMSLLAKRTPFEDDNIIYAIHTYEPFLFTHQGASWTNYGSIRNVPFPYDSASWSLFSSDYGVTGSTPSDAKTAIKNYYKTGNKENILKQVYVAKKWAVEHQVPIIINEFGAYNVKSDAQSILNYYTAMTEICDTLQIPWQHWGYTGGFAVIGDDGKLIEGLDKAMKLK